jgi:hypothetical protein
VLPPGPLILEWVGGNRAGKVGAEVYKKAPALADIEIVPAWIGHDLTVNFLICLSCLVKTCGSQS